MIFVLLSFYYLHLQRCRFKFLFCSSLSRVSNTTTACSQRRYQRATRLPILPTNVQLLLFTETAFPRQTRSIRYPVCVRILPTALPDKEQPNNAQELAAQGYHGRTQAFFEKYCNRHIWSVTPSPQIFVASHSTNVTVNCDTLCDVLLRRKFVLCPVDTRTQLSLCRTVTIRSCVISCKTINAYSYKL